MPFGRCWAAKEPIWLKWFASGCRSRHGFTVSTEACNAFLKSGGAFPRGMWDQVLSALQTVEAKTGKRFGGDDNPLLVSCRSGAKFSMPGMMDTVLNIGLNSQTVAAMIRLTDDPRFVYDAYRRLIQMFGSVVMGIADEPFEEVITAACREAGVDNRHRPDGGETGSWWPRQFKALYRRHTTYDFPEDPLKQLKMATEAVFKSWNGKRAVDYRKAAGISHDLGTAVSIVSHGFRQHGRRLRHRRGHDPQRLHRRERSSKATT